MPERIWPPPGFPIVQGDYPLTDTWMLHLPEPFARRIEERSLVLWRPGLTLWLAAWDNNHNKSQADRASSAKSRASVLRFDEREQSANGVTRFGYRLHDANADGPVESINALFFADEGHLQLSVYFDDVSDEAEGWQIVESVRLRT
ncbi:MAG: hypothetical protein K1X74_10850 [Pirellulales bacterium]|nr:hypothetical protein [Pirellulales bacterium]